MRFGNLSLVGFLCTTFAVFTVASARANSYNETSGDLSNDKLNPTPLTLSVGTNQIIGNVNGSTDSQDWIKLTVPAGDLITAYINAAYSSTDNQGFTGFEFGSTFTGNAGAANGYNGFAHFGTNSSGNAAGAAANTVGVNLLPAPYMAASTSQGALGGFTTTLGQGDYTFLIQQLGASTSYEFDVTVVPEPGSLCLMTIWGLLILAPTARKRRRKMLTTSD